MDKLNRAFEAALASTLKSCKYFFSFTFKVLSSFLKAFLHKLDLPLKRFKPSILKLPIF
jgi:hypothetical protein